MSQLDYMALMMGNIRSSGMIAAGIRIECPSAVHCDAGDTVVCGNYFEPCTTVTYGCTDRIFKCLTRFKCGYHNCQILGGGHECTVPDTFTCITAFHRC